MEFQAEVETLPPSLATPGEGQGGPFLLGSHSSVCSLAPCPRACALPLGPRFAHLSHGATVGPSSRAW